jgi:hypothetical protein
VSGATTLRLIMGRNIPLPLLVSAWHLWGNNILTVIISFGKPFDHVPLRYVWKRAVVFCSKLHRLFVTVLGLICRVGVMDSY